jgi:HEAT repeat protein
VSLLVVLVVVAVAQAIFVVMLTLYVLVRRERLLRRANRLRLGRTRTGTPLAHWLTGSGSAQRIADALRAMPRDAALSFASELRDVRVPQSMRASFAMALRDEPWVAWALAGASSVRWWRRLDAARALGIIGTLADAALLRQLLGDRHPAVRLAATHALVAVDDPDLVKLVVARYPDEALAVRLFTVNTLKMVWQLSEEPLRAALSSDAPSASLAAWLNLAESLDAPRLRPTITALVRHADPEVRAPAARALRRYPHAESVMAVMSLLDDPQDFVRAAAAQALGVLRASEAQPKLERGLTDRAWWVRFRSALALALLGEGGRAVLRRARQSPDRFAREMAETVSGLSDGAVLELADA